MQQYKLTLVFCLLASLIFCSISHANTLLPKAKAVPGGIAVIALNGDPEQVYFKGHRVLVLAQPKQTLAVIGIPLSASVGRQSLKLVYKHNKTAIQHFQISNQAYPLRKITIKNKQLVTPNKTLAKTIARQRHKIKQLLAMFTPNAPASFTFSLPIKHKFYFTSPFGQRRILNNTKHYRHTGLDLAAKMNTPIYAAAKGTILYTGDFVILGRTVFINHGMGLISYYCHLNKILVHQGQLVTRDSKIGLLGSTGRSTGPHLHWSVSLNQTLINPSYFLVANNA